MIGDDRQFVFSLILSDRAGVELGERIHRYAGSEAVDYKRPVEDGLGVRLQGHRDAHQPR